MRPRLSVQNVSRAFGEVQAARDVSFEVEAGELFSLLGPSGCGKTTLLRILAGLEVPDSGKVLIDGVDVTHMPPHLRPVNMMFQRYALFPHLSVFDNIAYGLRQMRLSAAAIRDRVSELLALVRLDGYGERRPHQLSGGQQQRVALVRALARGPKLLLLDEPLAALDRRLRESTALELKRLQRDTDTTFIMVTHDQDEAMTLSTRVAVMMGGSIVQLASPRQIYERPQGKDVAHFIGDVNLLDADIAAANELSILLRVAKLGQFEVSREGQPPELNGRATLGIRPERFDLHHEKPAINAIAANIEAISYHGDVSVYHLNAGDERQHRLLARMTNSGLEAQFLAGDDVWLSFDPDDAFVLAS